MRGGVRWSGDGDGDVRAGRGKVRRGRCPGSRLGGLGLPEVVAGEPRLASRRAPYETPASRASPSSGPDGARRWGRRPGCCLGRRGAGGLRFGSSRACVVCSRWRLRRARRGRAGPGGGKLHDIIGLSGGRRRARCSTRWRGSTTGRCRRAYWALRAPTAPAPRPSPGPPRGSRGSSAPSLTRRGGSSGLGAALSLRPGGGPGGRVSGRRRLLHVRRGGWAAMWGPAAPRGAPRAAVRAGRGAHGGLSHAEVPSARRPGGARRLRGGARSAEHRKGANSGPA